MSAKTYTLFSPIDIRITDTKYFADVAFLVDRGDFIHDLLFLRKKWKLEQGKLLEINPEKQWKSFPWKWKNIPNKYGEKQEQLERILYNLTYMEKLPIETKEWLLSKFKNILRKQPSEDFCFDISDLRMKYKRPASFDQVIAHALLYGIVFNEDYITCAIEIRNPELDHPEYFEDSEIIIKVSPMVKIEEIRYLISKKLWGKKNEYEANILGGRLNDPNKTSAIINHRKWYWMNKRGLSPEKIFNHEYDRGITNIEESGVEKAISRYAEALRIPLTNP